MKPYQKLTIVIFLLLESYFAVSAQYENFKQKVFTGSAEAFLSLGQDIHSGRATAKQDWEKLFSTMGYTKYLNNPKGEMIKRELKEAMLLAFDPDRIAEADSILKHPATITNMPLVLRQNICRLARKREEADSFLLHTDFLTLLYRANEKTKKYLPERAWSSNPLLNDLFLIATIPDASVRDHAIFLDLNLALSMQEEELVDLFAHEFFHNYREMAYQGSSGDSFLNAFDLFQNEGIADLIDKKRNDDKIMQFFGEEFVKAYKEKFGANPDTFAALSYDATQLLMKAIEKAGSTDPQAITKALAETTDFDGVTGTFSMGADHTPVKSAVVIEFQNGQEVSAQEYSAE